MCFFFLVSSNGLSKGGNGVVRKEGGGGGGHEKSFGEENAGSSGGGERQVCHDRNETTHWDRVERTTTVAGRMRQARKKEQADRSGGEKERPLGKSVGREGEEGG